MKDSRPTPHHTHFVPSGEDGEGLAKAIVVVHGDMLDINAVMITLDDFDKIVAFVTEHRSCPDCLRTFSN